MFALSFTNIFTPLIRNKVRIKRYIEGVNINNYCMFEANRLFCAITDFGLVKAVFNIGRSTPLFSETMVICLTYTCVTCHMHSMDDV